MLKGSDSDHARKQPSNLDQHHLNLLLFGILSLVAYKYIYALPRTRQHGSGNPDHRHGKSMIQRQIWTLLDIIGTLTC